MRMNLRVPFAEKDQAKQLGARWDPALKVWYVAADADPAPFAKWSPTPHGAAAVPAAPPPGRRIVGSAYVETARRCDCLPWEVCDRCADTALGGKA